MQTSHAVKRKTRNLIHKIVGLFLIFSICLVCLLTGFLLITKTHTELITPLAIGKLIKFNQFTQTETTTDTIGKLLEKNNIETSAITVASDSSIVATLQSGQQIIFSENKNPAEQITSLQLIKARLTIEGKQFNRIDFRFDNPVVTF